MAKAPAQRTKRVIASAGHQGATVSILPRDGHPTQAQAQWNHPTTRTRQRRTISNVRLSTDGTETSKAQKTQLQQVATILHTRLTQGEPMPGEHGCPSWATILAKAAPKKKGQVDDAAPGALTVREALAAAYGPSYADQVNAKGGISGRHVRKLKGKASGGLAISTWTDHARDLRRLADVVEEALGPDAPWGWSESTFTALRDALIERVRTTTQPTKAPQKLRRVHKVLQCYIRATRLVQRAYRDRDDTKPKPQALSVSRWLTGLKEAWTAAGLLLPEEEQPRYSRKEAGMIYVEGTSRRHDPRYGLWLLLGAEGRPVQILRARRSHIEDEYRDTPRGLFRGPGTRLKHGLAYAPTPAHRLAIDEYLNGYLAQYEERYRRGEIDDYPLFPSGQLRDGRIAEFRADVRPWGYRQFLGDPAHGTGYYAIESGARVRNVPGRGPYGLKYAIADLVPLVAGRLGIGDNVAVNLATAHDTPGTAPQYRKKVRSQPGVLVMVGKLIWNVRKDLREAAELGVEESRWGIAPEAEHIARYQVGPLGVTIQTALEEYLWVPWAALSGVGKQDPLGVDKLIKDPELAYRSEVDDDAREIRFPRAGVALVLDVMLVRARVRGKRAVELPTEPMFRKTVWWRSTPHW